MKRNMCYRFMIIALKTISLILIHSSLFSIQGQAQNEDANWSMFHKDARNSGFSPSPMPAPASMELLFTFQAPMQLGADQAIYSSPVVANNMVYIIARNRKLYCLNAVTGVVQWSRVLGDSWDLAYAGGDRWIDPSPAVAEGKVFVTARDGRVYAFHAGSGNLLWRNENIHPGWAIFSSPTYHDGKLVFGDIFGQLHCLETEYGTPVQGTPILLSNGSAIITTPALAGYEGGLPCFVCGSDYGPTGGNTMHTVELTAGGFVKKGFYNTDCTVRSSAATQGVSIYQGDGSGGMSPTDLYAGLLCFNGYGGGSHPLIPSWAFPGDTGPQGNFEWTCATPAVGDGDRIYMGGGKGAPNVYCLKDNGSACTQLWKFNVDDVYAPMGVTSSPAAADGKVYIGLTRLINGSKQSWLYCLNGNSGEELWSQMIGWGDILSSPAIYEGKVYIGTPCGKLRCFGDADGGN